MAIPEASLREELSALRKKVVALETAEADNEKLRKELNKLRVAALEQKSELELEFMNQLTGVARENSLKLEELEGRLAESNNVNMALSDQLKQSPSPQDMRKQIDALEAQHRRDLAQTIDANKLEIETTRKQLNQLMESRDKLMEEFDEVAAKLSKKETEIEYLKAIEKQSVSISEIEDIERQLEEFKSSREGMSRELQETRAVLKSKDDQIKMLEEKLRTSEESSKRQLEDALREVDGLKEAKRRLESQLTDERDKVQSTKAETEAMHLAKVIRNNDKIRDMESTINRLISELEATKSDLASKEYEIDRLNSTHASVEESIECRIEERLDVAKAELSRKYEIETRILKERVNARDGDLAAKNQEINRLQSQSTQTSKRLVASEAKVQSLEHENSNLKEALEQTNGVVRAEVDPHMQPKTLFGKQGSRDVHSEVLVNRSHSKSGSGESPQFNQHEKKTTQIIRRLEENLKKEGKSKQVKTAGLKVTTPNDMDDQSMVEMQQEIASLQKTLDAERSQTSRLREEISNLKETAPSVSERKTSLLMSTPSTPNRVKPPLRDAVSSTPVRGLVEDYEMKISSLNAKRIEADDFSVIDSNDIEEVRDALHFERQQVFDLEEELTRQCEMNCKLLKEISSLTKEAESNRTRSAIAFNNAPKGFERLRIEKMTGDISDLEKALKFAETEKTKLAHELEKVTLSDEKEIEQLTSELTSVKTRLQDLESRLSDLDTTKLSLQKEKRTVAELTSTITSLHTELGAAEANCQRLSSELELHKQAEGESKSRMLDKMEALSKELEKANEERDEIEMNCRMNHTGKMDSLASKIKALSSQLENVTEERDEANEQNRIHNDKFDHLRAEIDKKVEESERIHANDQQEISRLQSELASMEKRLGESLSEIENLRLSLKKREELEQTVEDLQRQNQHALDSQINKLQKELTSARLSESEMEKRAQSLQKLIESMEVESTKTLESNEATLNETKDLLASKDGIIDRLKKEKEQLVLSMKDMTMSRRDEIDELRNELMEMSTRAANQAREVQTLKVQLEESEYRKEEMDRLRKRVRDLSEEVTTRSGAANGRGDDDRTSELQLENSTLRQRLRDANLSLKLAEDKMRDFVSDKGSSKAMQVLRDRNVTLKFEVEKLTKKLQRLADRKHQKPKADRVSGVGDRSIPSARYSYGSEHSAQDAAEATRFMI